MGTLKTILLFSVIFLNQLGSSAQSYTSVDKWLSDLASSDMIKKQSAALAFDSLVFDKEIEYKKLLKALKHPDPFVRQYVSYTIGTLQHKPQVSIPVLISQFRDEDKKVRQYACVAVGMFGEQAIKYLLDSLQNNKGPLDEDGPGNFHYEDSIIYKANKGLFKTGMKNKQDEYYLTRTSLYCLLGLRMLDGAKVTKSAKKRVNIPKVFKQVIFSGKSYKYAENEVSSANSYTRPDLKVIDTLHEAATVDELLHRVDSPIIETRRLDRKLILHRKLITERLENDSSRQVAYSILFLHPFLVKYIKTSLLEPGKKITFRDTLKILSILANSGQYGKGYLPELNKIIHQEDHILQHRAYLAAGYILTDRYRIFQPYDQSVETSGRILELSENLLFKEITPFYLTIVTPVSDEPKEAEYSGESYALFYSIKELDNYLIIEDSFYSNKEEINDTLLTNFIMTGLEEKSIYVKTMALQFSKYLSQFDSALVQKLSSYLASDNYYLQEAAVDVGLSKNIFPFSVDNLANVLKINRIIIERFHSESIKLFGGEGTPGLGGWGAGGAGGSISALSFWPPAPCTTRGILDISGLYSKGTLGSVQSKLIDYLQTAGYPTDFYRLFPILDGFAIMTHSEKTNAKGEIIKTNRWSKDTEGDFFSILAKGKAGYWRSITFIVNQSPNFSDNGSPFRNISINENVYNTGGFALPEELLKKSCNNYYLHVLVYHYYQKNGGIIRQIKSGENSLSISDHLNSLGIPLKFLN